MRKRVIAAVVLSSMVVSAIIIEAAQVHEVVLVRGQHLFFVGFGRLDRERLFVVWSDTGPLQHLDVLDRFDGEDRLHLGGGLGYFLGYVWVFVFWVGVLAVYFCHLVW